MHQGCRKLERAPCRELNSLGVQAAGMRSVSKQCAVDIPEEVLAEGGSRWCGHLSMLSQPSPSEIQDFGSPQA